MALALAHNIIIDSTKLPRNRKLCTTRRRVGQGLRQNQGNTVYQKGNLLFADNAADVDLKKEAGNLVDVVLFSDDYFKLLEHNSMEENRLLASQRRGEELIIRLRGKIYRIK